MIILVISIFTDAQTIVAILIELISLLFPPEKLTQAFVNEITDQIQSILDTASAIGWYALPAVFWLGSTLFGSIRTALNAIFNLHEPGFFLKYKLKDIGILLVFTFLIAFVGVANTLITLFEAILAESIGTILPIIPAMNKIVSVLITMLFFYFLYTLPPHGALPKFIVRTSTIISTALWEAAKYLFAWYIGTISSYGTIYGTYAIVVVSALWLYYTWLIFLLSSEIALYIYEQR